MTEQTQIRTVSRTAHKVQCQNAAAYLRSRSILCRVHEYASPCKVTLFVPDHMTDEEGEALLERALLAI